MGGGSGPGGCLPLVLGGVPASRPWGVPGPVGIWFWGDLCIPACNGADPPVNRITDTCKNITFANFVAGGNYHWLALVLEETSSLNVG